MLCAKCRQATPRSDDTWCLGCSATESLNFELSAHWHCEGLRALSHEVVVGAVRSLRLISSGLKSAEDSRAALERRTPRPLPAPRGHSVPPPPPAPPRVPREPKREEESEEGEESESEEEEPAVGLVPSVTLLKHRLSLNFHQGVSNLSEPPKKEDEENSIQIITGTRRNQRREKTVTEQELEEAVSTLDCIGSWKIQTSKFIDACHPVFWTSAPRWSLEAPLLEGDDDSCGRRDRCRRRSGIHYSLQDRESWDSLGPVRGQILEVYLPDCIEGAPDIWAGLLVMQVEMDSTGELFAEVKSLGCSDAHYTKELSSMFNRRRGVVHFCMTSDCLEEINGLHVTQVVLYDREGFHRAYITHATTRQMNKGLSEDTAPGGLGNTLILGDTRGADAALDAGAAERPGVLRNVKDPRVRKDQKDAEEQEGKPHPGRQTNSERREQTRLMQYLAHLQGI